MDKVQQELRAFVGQTAFEELAQQWVRQQARQGALPFVPERIGSHWSRTVQVDVAGVNWRERQLLLGECKWGEATIDKGKVRALLETRGPRVLRKMGVDAETWPVTYLFFARSGFTPAAHAYGREMDVQLLDLDQMMTVLDHAPDV